MVLALIPAIVCLMISSSHAKLANPIIDKIDVTTVNNNIIVNIGIDNVEGFEDSINSGIEKEIVFRVELLKNIRLWPDEFIVSKKIRRYIGYDMLRGEYYLSWKEGGRLITRYFDKFDEMKPFVFNVSSINLMNTRGLDDGRYYVRVIVESKSKQPLRIMGMLMFLMPEVEISLIKESFTFEVMNRQ
ncbi:MAG: hypothetical protein Fur0020_01360 [Thermodesulfovibrionia bacterium]